MKKLCDVEVGFTTVRVMVDNSDMGMFTILNHEDGAPPNMIVVGLANMPFTTLYHELFELVATLQGCRYSSCLSISGDGGRYSFIFNHLQFSEICAWVSDGMEAIRPHLVKAIREHKKKNA